MKSYTSGVLNALLLAAGFAFAATTCAAPTHSHEAHAEHGAPATLQLNDGKKWETDAALRQAMDSLRQIMAASLPEIHESRLPVAGYSALARKVDSEVGNIVSNCKLEPKADAQLHLIVADLLTGSEQMAGKVKKAKRQDGVVKVVGALEKYASYFDHPNFKPLLH